MNINLIAQKQILLALIVLFALLALFGIILFKMILEVSSKSSHCPPSIMAYWDFNQRKSQPFIDIYGANDAICINCPDVVASGRIDGGLSFDGVDDKLTVSNNHLSGWQERQSFTIEGWISTTLTSQAQVVMSQAGDEAGDEANDTRTEEGKSALPSQTSRWRLALSDERATFELADSTGIAATLEGTSSITDGRWHHLAAVRDKSRQQVRLYVDGRTEYTATVRYRGDFSNSGQMRFCSGGSVL